MDTNATADATPAKDDPTIGHTPTPWRQVEGTRFHWIRGPGDAYALAIETERGDAKHEALARANAALLVRAVNAHEALRAIAAHVVHNDIMYAASVVDAARAALKLARGEA